MMIEVGPPGPKFTAGHTDLDGHPILVRDDGSSVIVANVRLLTGTATISDNGDGTCTLTVEV